MFIPPPPIPLDVNSVAAGPVLSAGRMVWAQEEGERLVVRAQRRNGRVEVVADFPPPEVMRGYGDRVAQLVTALSVRGREVAIRRDAIAETVLPNAHCFDPGPCHSVSGQPTPPTYGSVDRGRFGHVRSVAEYTGYDQCRLPEQVALTPAGVVREVCTFAPDTGQHTDRVIFDGRTLGSGELDAFAAAGNWETWHVNGARTVVRRIGPKPKRYTVPALDAGSLSDVDTGGHVALFHSDLAWDPCSSHMFSPLSAVTLASPSAPAGARVIKGERYLRFAVWGGSLAYSHVLPGCPFRYQSVLRRSDGSVVTLGTPDPVPPSGFDMDREEVAVLEADGLHRYAR